MNKYLGVLRWSLQYTDNTSDTVFTEMDAERRQWLKEALESQVVDPAEQMKNLINVIKIERTDKMTDESEKEFAENKVQALAALCDWVEQIDWAADLHKLGGFESVIQLMKDDNESIRCGAMDVFATVVQNNPVTQTWAMELGALPILMERTKQESALSEKEQAKILLSVASMVRHHTPASIAFIKEHAGIAWLMKFISGDDTSTKARRKSLFLMRYFFDSVPAIKISLADALCLLLSKTMLDNDVDVRDHSLQLLIAIFSDKNAVDRVDSSSRATVTSAIENFKPDGDDDFTIQHVEALKVKMNKPIFSDETTDAPKLIASE